MSIDTLIVIPARYGSTRLPGKPLQMIAGKSLLHRVCAIGLSAVAEVTAAKVIVATDDERIAEHAEAIGVSAVMTPEDCASGTDRCYHAAQKFAPEARYILSLQGDAPLTPVTYIRALIDTLLSDPTVMMATPIVQLSWQSLAQLRSEKLSTPHSGTTVIRKANGNAHWFSKQIIPLIRGEDRLSQQSEWSPVYKHIGVYAYTQSMLQRFVEMPLGHYEQLEGLEQLRVLEQGYDIRTVVVPQSQYPIIPGVDTAIDVERVVQLLQEYGELQS